MQIFSVNSAILHESGHLLLDPVDAELIDEQDEGDDDIIDMGASGDGPMRNNMSRDLAASPCAGEVPDAIQPGSPESSMLSVS